MGTKHQSGMKVNIVSSEFTLPAEIVATLRKDGNCMFWSEELGMIEFKRLTKNS